MSKIKNIRTLPVIAVLGVLTCWSSIVSADPITVDFEITGFDSPGTLTGWFTGDDLSNGGYLTTSEITDFGLIWSGNSITDYFEHGFGQLTSLLYRIGDNSLRSLSSSSGDGSASINRLYASVNGPAPTVCRYYIFCSDKDKQKEWHPGITTTTKVPEPGTLTLFGIGLLAVGFATRRRQVLDKQ